MARGHKVWLVSAAVCLAVSGVVVATAGPAGATNVSTEAALRAAFGNAAETKIDLDADIELSDCGDNALDVTRISDTDLTLDGHGHTIRQTCPIRVFEMTGAGALTVQNVTITGGDATFNNTQVGGGIAHFGPGLLTVAASTVTGNKSEGGGALFGDGGIAIINSTINENSAVYNSAADSELDITVSGSTITKNTTSADSADASGTIGATGSVTVLNSAITNNTNANKAAVGSSGPVTIVNSTVANNTPDVGVFSDESVTLVYATVVDNGSGPENEENVVIFNGGGLTSFGSVVAQAKGGADNCFIDGGSTTSNGFNFSDDDTCGFTNAAQGDRQNAGDPALGALGNNGGKTETRKPSDTSPLKDAIAAASCKADGAAEITADQVGTVRPQGSGCDVGAVEVAQAAATTTTTSASSASAPPAASSSSNAKSSSGGAPIALIVLAVLVIGGIVIALLLRRRRSDEAA
ncbi:MAG: hypothetical protein QOD92_3969 [Acidimicrobiaceae bacterium]|jgi:hypothetical protein